MQNPALLRALAWIGIAGALFPILADMISWLLAENYSPIANSISTLAVGASSWLIDLGIWAFLLACFAVAAALWAWRVAARYWTGALVALVLVGVCSGIVASLNEYAGTENQGANIHLWAVCGIGVFFALAALLAVPGLRTRSDALPTLSLAIGVIWIVLCPVYWFFTDEWSGAVERLMALLMIGWLVALSRASLAMASEPEHRHVRA